MKELFVIVMKDASLDLNSQSNRLAWLDLAIC